MAKPTCFDYVHLMYGVRFKRGQRVIAVGEPGRVTRADHLVHVRLDRLKYSLPYHPTDVRPETAE